MKKYKCFEIDFSLLMIKRSWNLFSKYWLYKVNNIAYSFLDTKVSWQYILKSLFTY